MTVSTLPAPLERCGYTDPESRFLTLAAHHGGYFLRRQYAQFLGRAVGATSSQLIEKAVARNHVRALVFANNTIVYHLCARPFYNRIGEPENRNRRERQPLSIKNRLMTLDYVLSNPEHRFLATEQEKFGYFVETLGLLPRELPQRQFRSFDGSDSSLRYFLDKSPISLTTTGNVQSVSFAFVDEGLTTMSRFDTFLGRNRALFTALGAFELVYVASSAAPFEDAAKTFERFAQTGSSAAIAEDERGRLLQHFRDRRDYESRRLDTFDRARLIRFRADRETFSGASFDASYRRWSEDETSFLEAKPKAHGARESLPQPTFKTYWIRHNYDFFGTLTNR